MEYDTFDFHRIAHRGSLAELRDVLASGIAVDIPGDAGQTALMFAVQGRDLDKMKLLLEAGADPELSDDSNETPLRKAVSYDFAPGVEHLLSLGVDRGYSPKYPRKEVTHSSPEVAAWANLQPTRLMIQDVQSVAVLKLFLAAGDDLQFAPNEVKRAFVGLQTTEELQATPADYHAQKHPRFGEHNPERLNFPFWQDMVRTNESAWAARRHFQDEAEEGSARPVWSFNRFGSTITPLPDGRFVQIAGEHEDFYDPDFWIYNDVVVHDGQGGFEILGYPRDVFPPTDFHSATLVGDSIYIVGCLGYQGERREGFTPVYRLQLESWSIERMETAGEFPGWLHRHQAFYFPTVNTITVTGGKLHVMSTNGSPDLVPNRATYELSLASLRWQKRA